MAARRTPTEIAIANVEKAIKAHDTALEKSAAAQAKADEAVAVANRADRELDWMAHHPDLPEDFDLDAFRRSLEAPFDEAIEKEADGDPAENPVEEEVPSAPEPDALKEEREFQEGPGGDGAVPAPAEIDVAAAIGAADDEGDDDPWGDD